MSKYLRASGLALAVGAALPLNAWSQVEEIVVTTRRRAESLQEVPIAVTALTSEQIQRQGIASIGDIVKLTPSVQFDVSYGPADTRVTVRGLSNTRGRSNVAFLVDGIDVTTENLNAAGSGLLVNRRLLSDVERIEVVKGPQSALYGRAAFAGAINYITKAPGDEWEGNIRWDVGDYGNKQFDVAAGGPVIKDKLGVRLSSVYWEEDGYYENSVSGEPVGDSEGWGVALTSLFTPTDEIELKLRMEYSDEKYGPLPNVRLGGGTSGVNLQLFEYSQDALDAGLGTNANRPVNGSTSTALVDFGQYCPPELKDPSRGPGFCLPRALGSAEGLRVTHSENPLTGRDYEGTDIETFRASLIATFDVGELGTLVSSTGWTDFQGNDAYDQDWQAIGRPDTLVAAQQANADTDTKQFSQELRFSTQLDGPFQFTAGALFWDESRSFSDKTFIIFCAPVRWDGNEQRVVTLPGYCDGGPTANGNGRTTVSSWQEYYLQEVDTQPRVPWEADTRHWSFYGVIEWELAEDWTLTFEERFVSERFTIQKPAFSNCTAFASPNPANASLEREQVDPNTGEIINDVRCTADIVLDPEIAPGPPSPALGTAVGWRLQKGSVDSHFNTPRVILEWTPTDDAMVYFSWARAQKPGGIAATPGGGSPVSIEDDKFLPEKMEAWELGTKTTWEAAGQLQANIAGFFQDYTDKQIGTQVIVDGFLQPRIVNASAAEVWGAELELLWAPSFVEGLTLNFSWTYLDATYSDFIDTTTSVQRAASTGSCEVVYRGDPTSSNPAVSLPACALNFTGNQLERTPENAGVIGFNYTQQFFDSGFDWFVAENGPYFEDYWLVDARLGLQGEQWDFMVYVDNVFDDDTIKSGGSGPDFGTQVNELGFTAGLGVTQFFGTLPEPRVYGLRAAYRF